MARISSTMLPLGTAAHNFNLPDTISGKNISLEQHKGEIATVVMFICNHCPFVIHVQDDLVKLANDYYNKGISFIAISSNDIIAYPEDHPTKMTETASLHNYPFPYLFDETQEVAKAYKAACTPDFYIFNKDLNLVYRGQMDDSRPGNNIPVTGRDLRNTLESLLHGNPVNANQMPSIGCGIKWK